MKPAPTGQLCSCKKSWPGISSSLFSGSTFELSSCPWSLLSYITATQGLVPFCLDSDLLPWPPVLILDVLHLWSWCGRHRSLGQPRSLSWPHITLLIQVWWSCALVRGSLPLLSSWCFVLVHPPLQSSLPLPLLFSDMCTENCQQEQISLKRWTLSRRNRSA